MRWATIYNPYTIAWENVDPRPDEPRRGTTLIYGHDHDCARESFYRSHSGRFLVKSVELDVRRAELDLALYVAYRAKQTCPKPAALRRVREILAACRIDRAAVAPELRRLGLPI